MWLNRPVPYDRSRLIFSRLEQFQSIHMQQHKTPSQTEPLSSHQSLRAQLQTFSSCSGCLDYLFLPLNWIIKMGWEGRVSRHSHIHTHTQIIAGPSSLSCRNREFHVLCPNVIIAHHLNSVISDYDLTFSCGSISFYPLSLPLKNKPELLAFLLLGKI